MSSEQENPSIREDIEKLKVRHILTPMPLMSEDASSVPSETYETVENETEDSVTRQEASGEHPQRYSENYDVCLKCFTLLKLGARCSVCGHSNQEIKEDLHKTTILHNPEPNPETPEYPED